MATKPKKRPVKAYRRRAEPKVPVKDLKKNKLAIAKLLAEELIGEKITDGENDYRPEYAQLAAIVVSVYGSTPSELGKVFGVPATTIAMWINRQADFRDAIENATRNCNVRVMERLFRQCMGYKVKVERLFYDGRQGRIVKGMYTEHVKPDTSAMVFWLKNRMPDKWQDKTAAQIDGKGLASDIQKLFDQKVTPDAAIDTYNKLLEIEHQAVQIQPEEVIFTQKRPKAEVEIADDNDRSA